MRPGVESPVNGRLADQRYEGLYKKWKGKQEYAGYFLDAERDVKERMNQ